MGCYAIVRVVQRRNQKRNCQVWRFSLSCDGLNCREAHGGFSISQRGFDAIDVDLYVVGHFCQCSHTPTPDPCVFVGQTLDQGAFRGFADVAKAPGGDECQFGVGKEFGEVPDCWGAIRAQHFESRDALQLTFGG